MNDNLFISDVFLNVLPKLTVNNSTMYYGSSDEFSFNLSDGEHVFANESVLANIIGAKNNYTFNLTSDSNGLVSFKLPDLALGKYFVIVNYTCDDNEVISNTTLNIAKAPSKLVLSSYSAFYNSGKKYNVKLVNTKNNKAVSGVKINLKVFTGKKYKSLSLKQMKKV